MQQNLFLLFLLGGTINGHLSQSPDVTSDIIDYCSQSCSQRSEKDDPSWVPCRQKPPITPQRTPSIATKEQSSAFEHYFGTIGIEKIGRKDRDFCQLTERSQLRKAASIRAGYDFGYQIVAPESPETLKKMVFLPDLERTRTHRLGSMMRSLKAQFERASCRTEKLHLLTIAAKALPLQEIRHFISGISEFFYAMAKRHSLSVVAREARSVMPPKFNPEAVASFIEFMTSDWSPKLQPYKRNTTKEYSAKSGISYQLIQFAVNIRVEHALIIHIGDKTSQESLAVSSFLNHTLQVFSVRSRSWEKTTRK